MRWLLLTAVSILFLSMASVLVARWVAIARMPGEFIHRAGEVDPLIDSVYLSYYDAGAWPETLTPREQAMLTHPNGDWQYVYHGNDPDTPPELYLTGPLHMRLRYTFRKQADLNSTGGWKVSCEGDELRHSIREAIPRHE